MKLNCINIFKKTIPFAASAFVVNLMDNNWSRSLSSRSLFQFRTIRKKYNNISFFKFKIYFTNIKVIKLENSEELEPKDKPWNDE